VLDVLRDHQREQEVQRALYGPDYRSDLNLVFCRPDGYYYSPDQLLARVGVAQRMHREVSQTRLAQRGFDARPEVEFV
jgi:hypothetical protein